MAHKLALHSVSYAGLWGQAYLSPEQFIDKTAELGFDGVMLMAKRPHLSVLDYDGVACGRLRARLEKNKLQAICLAGYTNFTADLEHGDIPQREIQIQHVTGLARIAHNLGCDLVRVFTGYEHAAAGYSAQWKMIVEALRECAKRASAFDVTIGVQNHHDIASGYESLSDLIAAVNEPNCKALFDAWAPALQGADLAEAAACLGGVTVHTTLANYVLRPRYKYDPNLVNYFPQPAAVQAVPMNDGFIDYHTFLGALWDRGFTGSIAYEMCSPLRDGNSIEVLDSYARQFLEYMAEISAEKTASPR
jgi:sugar phosphate isomerase/epimerase